MAAHLAFYVNNIAIGGGSYGVTETCLSDKRARGVRIISPSRAIARGADAVKEHMKNVVGGKRRGLKNGRVGVEWCPFWIQLQRQQGCCG